MTRGGPSPRCPDHVVALVTSVSARANHPAATPSALDTGRSVSDAYGGGEIGEHAGRLVPIMTIGPMPSAAAWHHRDARQGFEVVYFHAVEGGYRIDGHTAAVENDQPWVVRYAIVVDTRWTTRSASVTGHWPTGSRTIDIEA